MVERLLLEPPPPKRKRGRPPGGNKGRPFGARNKSSKAERQAAAKTGALPHQILLKIARMMPGDKYGEYEVEFEDIIEAAKAAAQFYAPKFASITIQPADRPPVNVQLDPRPLANLAPDDLLKILDALIKASTQGIIDAESTPVINPDADIEDIDPSLYERTLQ
jgi:hypothetical protein